MSTAAVSAALQLTLSCTLTTGVHDAAESTGAWPAEQGWTRSDLLAVVARLPLPESLWVQCRGDDDDHE